MQTQTDFVATKAKATRDLMLQVDTAAAKHSKAGLGLGPLGAVELTLRSLRP